MWQETSFRWGHDVVFFTSSRVMAAAGQNRPDGLTRAFSLLNLQSRRTFGLFDGKKLLPDPFSYGLNCDKWKNFEWTKTRIFKMLS